MIEYNEKVELSDQLTSLYGLAKKNNNKVVAWIAEAKTALGIESKAKRMPDDMKRSIWKYHYDKLSPDIKPDSSLECPAPDAVAEPLPVVDIVLLPDIKRVNKGGRPRKYANNAERCKAHRQSQRDKLNLKRVEVRLDFSALWRVDALAKEWGVTASDVIQRLVMEANKQYPDILKP